MSPSVRIIHADCRDAMREMPENSVDAIVTDSPYGLSKEPDMAEVLQHWLAGDDYVHSGKGFMGKSWDSFVPGPSVWREAIRVLKPGGHCISFFGTRTYDMGVTAMRLAGFEIRDLNAWIFGQGFPKSLDVSKAIDKAAGAEREVIGPKVYADGTKGSWRAASSEIYAQDAWTQDGSDRAKLLTAPATDAARQWDGWGTALKPALEPIVLARKPLSEGTVAANVLRWGTGALNVDGCRVPGQVHSSSGAMQGYGGSSSGLYERGSGRGAMRDGRWPPNVCTDGSQIVMDLFPERRVNPPSKRVSERDGSNQVYGGFKGTQTVQAYDADGSAARFYPSFPSDDAPPAFYCAKANKKDRAGSRHPTIKPQKLLKWYCRLVTPPGGTVLDPFAGSGSTLQAARDEGFDSIGIEMEAQSIADCYARLGMTPPALQAAE